MFLQMGSLLQRRSLEPSGWLFLAPFARGGVTFRFGDCPPFDVSLVIEKVVHRRID